MHALVHVTDVEVIGRHRLRLCFDDGAVGIVDFADRKLTGVFAPLADQEYFSQVKLDAEIGTIAWPNGADVAPDTLHAWACARPAG